MDSFKKNSIKSIFIDSDSANNKATMSKIVWLFSLIILTTFMIALGAYTRLSGSGLSMVDWNLITGIIPPLTENQWMESFSTYKKFPEYQLIKTAMSLEEYRFIYLVEYSHRMLGRLIGLVTIIPFLLLSIMQKLNGREKFHGVCLILLIIFQGLMGWYMVQSGLIDVPNVSHYRLAAHFFLALAFITYCTMLLLSYCGFFSRSAKKTSSLFLALLVALVVIQAIFGTFVAGLDAGFVSKTYPKMFGQWLPLSQILPPNENFWTSFMQNPSTIHFFHRHFGVVVSLLVFIYCLKHLFSAQKSTESMAFFIAFSLSLIQPVLGIFTLLTGVNPWIAILHQLGAVFLFQSIFFLWLKSMRISPVEN